MKNKFKLEKRAKHPKPIILGSGCGARSNILGYCCVARPKIDGSSWTGRPNTFLKCFGFGWPATPNAITHFGSVLGLAWHPYPTTFGLAVKLEPSAFDREGNTPRRAGCKTARLGLQSGAPGWP